MMRWIYLFAFCICGVRAAGSPASQQFVGEWNFTNAPHYGPGAHLCMKLRAGIRLDIAYKTHNGTTKTATILADERVTVDEERSECTNSSSDTNETLALKFNNDRQLYLRFTRDPRITHDDKGTRWQLFEVDFRFVYDNATFPDSAVQGVETLSNTNTTLSVVATGNDHSYSCSNTGQFDVNSRFKMTLTNLQAQPFLTRDDFSQADRCATDRESTDLIPIIIGAALAALVIIVLIAYLIGRARASTPSYDNMPESA